MSEYLVVIENEGSSWGAYCPDLSGLGVVGESRGRGREPDPRSDRDASRRSPGSWRPDPTALGCSDDRGRGSSSLTRHSSRDPRTRPARYVLGGLRVRSVDFARQPIRAKQARGDGLRPNFGDLVPYTGLQSHRSHRGGFGPRKTPPCFDGQLTRPRLHRDASMSRLSRQVDEQPWPRPHVAGRGALETAKVERRHEATGRKLQCCSPSEKHCAGQSSKGESDDGKGRFHTAGVGPHA